jgi:ABC-2 type transport system permease protein
MLKFLVEKEFKQIFRNRFLPKMIVVFPFMMLLIMPLAANFETKNINVSVVDNDRSDYSGRLLRKMAVSGYFRIASVAGSYAEGLKAVELDKADIVLEIPAGFERDLVRERKASLMISANTVNGTKGGLGSSYLVSIVNDFGAEVGPELARGRSALSAPRLSVVTQFRYNPRLVYTVFMIPALMVMLMAMICGFLPALNIVGEKEKGTIEQMNVTPVRKSTFILSKLIPYWVIGFVVLSICFGVAWLVYGLVPVGSVITIYLFNSVFVLAISGFGLVISNYAKTVQQAMFMMFFFVVTFIFMSGLYTPVASMPAWAQDLSVLSPLKYFIMVMRLVYLKGSSPADLARPFLALCCFALFFNGWAVVSYRKKA